MNASALREPRLPCDARDDVDVVDIAFGVGATTLPVDYRGALRDAIAASLPWLGDEPHAGVFPLKTTPLDHVRALVSHRARLVLRLPRSRKEDALALCGRTLDIDGSLLVVGAARVRPIAASATLASAFVATGAVDELVHQQVVEQWLEDAGLPRRFVCGRLARLRCGSAQVAGGSLVLHGLSPEASLAVQRRGLGPQPLLGCGLFVPFKAIAVD